MRSSELYQIALIFLGIAATILFGMFLWREIYPEYKIYQNDYIQLEKFRSTYSGETIPPFSAGIKQIVIEREDKGPPTIDRCMSCHVALEFPHFSPTKLAYDINGNLIRNEEGNPVKIPNENYIWAKLETKIKELTDSQVNEQLIKEGNSSKVNKRLQGAEELKSLKIAQVGSQFYDVKKVLTMHPLMGKETRPFEFHPIEEYGCTSCHNGNGRGLTTIRAHGPVFDGTYSYEFLGPTPQFTEPDPKNDPRFAYVFNYKPHHELLFQTQPIYVGTLIQAKCMQCHQTSEEAFLSAFNTAIDITNSRQQLSKSIETALQQEKEAFIAFLEIKQEILANGLESTLNALEKKENDPYLSDQERDKLASRIKFFKISINTAKTQQFSKETEKDILSKINQQLISMLGSNILLQKFETFLTERQESFGTILDQFILKFQKDPNAIGTLFKKFDALDFEKQILHHLQDTETSITQTLSDQKVISSMNTDLDRLTAGYHRGKELYISQACYACHRIAGLSRGGVGPELTEIGSGYPWYLKRKLVWPQGDLASSTMPNYHLDHEELEPLVTFMLAQVGENKSVSSTAYKTAIQEWEAGRKLSWEKPITPVQMHDLRFAMTVFATQGCAACHRLKGFESNVGYRIEKEHPGKLNFETLYKEREWFTKLIPEMISGSSLVTILDQHADEINQRLADDVRQNSILEEIEKLFPETIESFYTNFRYASRSKNYYDEQLLQMPTNLKEKILQKKKQWKDLVHRVLMVYIQEYGLGRLIGPRPNWSGIYRSDEWLMEHFRKPSAHVARSIMPVLPFDDTKFYALTLMLDTLAKKNRDEEKELWHNRGFNPALAYEIHCSQCHGEFLGGDGPIAKWIYPIPKNLRNADFLRNLTKERVIFSITHGVKGTPMPPWGEVATDKPKADGIPILTKSEIAQLVDWLFANLPGGTVIRGSEDVPKWRYSPEDVLKELENEGNELKSNLQNPTQDLILGAFPMGKNLFAAVSPKVFQDTDSTQQVSDVFDIIPNPFPGPEKNHYYIKKKYFTRNNIEKGQAFFELNCAVCHGSEGDGTGARAEVMSDAKPRMLTNLDWLAMRDDLRLLRSIKYGVTGTAMTPWGDLTSSLQRLQLVIFIRSLSQESALRDDLATALYQAFNVPELLIERARIQEYNHIVKIQEQYEKVTAEEKKLAEKVRNQMISPQEAINLYRTRLSLAPLLKQRQETDQILLNLKKQIQEESKLYQELGVDFFTQKLTGDSFKKFLKIIELNANRYNLKDDQLVVKIDPENEKKIEFLEKQILSELENKIEELKNEEKRIKGKIFSSERTQALSTISGEINGLIKFRAKLVSSLKRASHLRQEQQQMFLQFQKKITSDETAKASKDL